MTTLDPSMQIVQLTWPETKAILIGRGIKKSILQRIDKYYFMRSIRHLPPAMRMIKAKTYQRTGKW